MDLERPKEGKIPYLEQGYVLHWDERGLRIQVIDYQAGVLALPWAQVLALAKIAQGAEDDRGGH
jgi:hypothetical protein